MSMVKNAYFQELQRWTYDSNDEWERYVKYFDGEESKDDPANYLGFEGGHDYV